MPRHYLLPILLLALIVMPWHNPQPDTPRTYANHNLAARAIFAGGSCNGRCALDVSSSDIYVEGGTHSNGCTSVPASATILPPNSVVDTNSPRPINPPPDVVAPIPMPRYYQITDFDEATDPLPALSGANY